MSSPYRRTHDSITRPPSYTPEIPVTRTSRSESSRTISRPRGSFSTGPFRDVPKASAEPLLPLTPDRPETNVGDTQLRMCESCEVAKSPVWDCSYCDMNFCDDCWSKQGPHKAGRTGPDGLPHEKANPTIVKRLQDILTPPQEHREQQMLHIEDEDTTWFGIARTRQLSKITGDTLPSWRTATLASSNFDTRNWYHSSVKPELARVRLSRCS
jgi:hypothetical protein